MTLLFSILTNAAEYLPGIDYEINSAGRVGDSEFTISAKLMEKEYKFRGPRPIGSLSIEFNKVPLNINLDEFANLDIVHIREITVSSEGSWFGTPTIYIYIPYSDYVPLEEIDNHKLKVCTDEEGFKFINKKYKVLEFDLKGNLKASKLDETCNH